MNKLKFSIWNINGLRAILKKPYLEDYLSKTNLDFLCFNEIRIDSKALTNMSLPAYITERFPNKFFNSAQKKGYSGVAILSKHKPLNTFYNFHFLKEEHIEGRILTLEYSDFYLICLYSPMSGQRLERLDERVDKWEVELFEYINNLKSKKSVIVCGDFNVAHQEIDLFNPKKNHNSPGFTEKERNKFNLLLQSGLVDCFRQFYPQEKRYTWWSALSKTAREFNRGWRLDYFLASQQLFEKKQIADCKIRDDILGSDHCPVELTVEKLNI